MLVSILRTPDPVVLMVGPFSQPRVSGLIMLFGEILDLDLEEGGAGFS